MKEKVKETIRIVIEKVKPKLMLIDEKINTLVPNPKMKKILYIGVGSLFGFMFLIIFLGLLLSPMRSSNDSTGAILKKPNIISEPTESQVELNENQKQILKLETEIKEMKFPASSLNIPAIESGLSI